MQSGAPFFLQDIEADSTHFVDVGMPDSGVEMNFWGPFTPKQLSIDWYDISATQVKQDASSPLHKIKARCNNVRTHSQ